MHGGLTGITGHLNTVGGGVVDAPPPQTLRQYYDACEKNHRDQLVLVQRAREKADRLNLMDHPREEVLGLIYFDHPF